MGENSKQVMVIGIDDSEHSFYALEWTITNFFNPPSASNFKPVIVHARPSPATVVGLAGPGLSTEKSRIYAGTTDVLSLVEADVKKTGERVTKKVKDLCQSKSLGDVQVDVVEGDARNVMCDAVEKYHATILVLGSHGYGAFKRAVLGSVSDYCSHHAHCTVMIVKKPKAKH